MEPTSVILERLTWTTGEERYQFFCPGCASMHCYVTKKGTTNGVLHAGPTWEFTGTTERPTFRASLLYHAIPEIKQPRCHLHITDGFIEYCNDCDHTLKGCRIPMVPIPPRFLVFTGKTD